MSFAARFLIARPLLTNVLLVIVILAAGASVFRIKRLGYPRVDFGRMQIHTVFPGASPEDVELNVTTRLEEALKSVTGVEKYYSRSAENISFIQVTIDPDAEDPSEVKAAVRRAIEGVSDLPPEVRDRPRIVDIKIDNQAVYEVALTFSGKKQNERILRDHARRLKRRLLELPSVARVREDGLRKREMLILLDRDKLARHYVSFDEVIQSIRRNKVRLSGGSLESFTTARGIVTLSEFAKPADIENIIVRSTFLGNRIRIRDVGRVKDGFQKRDSFIKYDGQRGVSLWVIKKGTADVINTVDAIKRTIARYEKQIAPPGMRFHSTRDGSIETRNRLSILYGNAALGLVLVVLVLFVFLDFRIAAWTAAGIPLSVAITLIILPWFNITINSISILGMVAVLGMIVDDAIIISESIYRFREEGLSAREAALRGLERVARPVFGTIVTTMIAFAPMYLIPGIVGDFSREIPSIVIIMLAASFIEATTVLPAHLGQESRRSEKPREPIGRALFARLEVLYVSTLALFLDRKYVTALGFLLFLLAAGLLGWWKTKVNMFPIDQAYQMWLTAELPRDSALEHTSRQSRKVEAVVASLPPGIVHSYKTIVGKQYDASSDAVHKTSSSFLLHLILTPATTREMSARDVREYIKKRLKPISTQNQMRMSYLIQGGGPPVGRPLEIQLLGQDNKKRLLLLEQVKAELKKLHVTDIQTDYRLGKEELRLVPNYETVAAAQLDVTSIANTIRTAFDGTVVTYLQTPDERIAFRVILDERSRDFTHPMRGLSVRNRQGQLVPLERLVRKVRSRAPESYYHYNSYRSNKITANIDETRTTADIVYRKLKARYATFEKDHPGFKIVLGGEAEKGAQFQLHMALAMVGAIMTIYLLLVVQFGSFTQPTMVVLAIPFGLAGIIVAFGLQNLEVSMLALIGILGFMGVVINDSLIMVDFINRIRRGGLDAPGGSSDSGKLDSSAPQPEALAGDSPAEFRSAVILGSRLRLRPIVLTTLTTVVGLVPTAYGLIGGYDAFVSPMVMAITWGLLVGTTSVLFVIPVFYAIHFETTSWLEQFFRTLRTRLPGWLQTKHKT